MLSFSTIFVGSFGIRASQEVFPTEVRSPEIRIAFFNLGLGSIDKSVGSRK
jgi:hypothetical protein